jgi:antitoxin HicB
MEYVARVTKEGRRRLVEFPDCPGCQTVVEPKENLQAVATEALEGWLEAHLVAGSVPPAPRSRPQLGLSITISPMLAAKIAIRRARQAAGLTQAELAKRAGLSQSNIARLEDPDHNPTLDTLERVAAALDADLLIEVRVRHAS